MIVDLIILATFLVSVLIAFFRGFIKEVLTVIGMGGAVVAAFFFAPTVEPFLLDLFIDPAAEEPARLFGVVPYSLVAKLAAYGGVFMLFSLILSLLSHTLSRAAENMGLGPTDRALGGLFGFIRAGILIGLLYLPMYYFLEAEQKQAWFGQAHSFAYLEWSAKTIDAILPGKENDKAKDGEDSVTEKLSDTV